MATLKNLQTLINKYPNNQEIKHQYGTSGFRYDASYLNHVAFRVGIFATLRARFTKAVIGAMITASHNPERDNGIKLIDPLGGMLESSWEPIVTELANIPDDELYKTIQNLNNKFKINEAQDATVYVGWDTRKSSPSLCKAFSSGVTAVGGKLVDQGLLTTPQLHYIIRCTNSDGQYGEPSEEGYYKKLSNAYLHLREMDPIGSKYEPFLVVDGANGVGTIKMKLFEPFLKNKLTFEIVRVENGVLNEECGADYVKVNQREPPSIQLKENLRYVSFDGDADRIIYYYKNSSNGKFQMLDGDKIAVLVAQYLKETLKKAGLDGINISIIQTAYANGSSTKYIREVLGLETHCVSTGVKHLHHKAEQCQIGVYFEANGHGTILFSEEVQTKIKACQNPSAQKLVHFIDLVNQTVGDAISDMLMVEIVLSSLNISIDQWNAFYTDLPNRLLKLAVKDRNAITTTDAERRCTKPPGLQNAIDQLVNECGSLARSFVRPSGTEDVVRIYAEAETQEIADNLAKKVANAVYDLANGVGKKFEL